MNSSPYAAAARINLEHICGNYRLLCGILAAGNDGAGSAAGRGGMEFAWPALMPVVKSDAYGHGHVQVAHALMEREGAAVFASGHVREAAALRRGLDAKRELRSAPPRIVSLLGPLGPDDLRLCADFGIIPAIHSFEQISWLRVVDKPLPVAIKCNSGMARLGFNPEEMEEAAKRLGAAPGALPVLALSHLAKADADEESIRAQAAAFAGMLEPLRRAWPDMAVSLCNSAGTLQSRAVSEIIGRHVCRPGIALYGANPLHGTALAPLGKDFTPAMAVSAPIMAVRSLAPGEGFGYGHAFVAEKKTRVGIVAAGYADHLARGLSNRGFFCAGGKRARILGRVSMQMTAVDLSDIPESGAGELVWPLGGPCGNAVRAEELADILGTISYEVLCLMGSNPRIYEASRREENAP
ncbi:MAG: alanine racemase [Desulfovibrio sp.]|nr:alanine racemase [Desulfovibrio sp.]